MFELKTERLYLRKLTIEDVKCIHELNSLPETDRYNTLGIPKDKSQTEALVMDCLFAQNETPQKRFFFCIENKEKQFIGFMGVNLGKPGYSSAEVWYKIHSNYWNKGYATEAVKEVLNFCFTELKLHRLEAGCVTKNKASIKVLEKSGFQREGMCRKKLPIRGKWIDNYEYAILIEDYKTLSNPLL